jgi:hypothetical protein
MLLRNLMYFFRLMQKEVLSIIIGTYSKSMILASYWTAMFDRFHLPLALASIGWRNLQIVRQRQKEIINGKELHPLLMRHYLESIHLNQIFKSLLASL